MAPPFNIRPCDAVVIGAGPAGLMAAHALLDANFTGQIHVLDHMPSMGRKFLMAGKSGLNLTFNEPLPTFISRYSGTAAAFVQDAVRAQLSPTQVRQWAGTLGIETFIGSSGKVFPADFKAAPLLRAWVTHLKQRGVSFHMRQSWCGWGQPTTADTLCLCFQDTRTATNTPYTLAPKVAILALGGGSWGKLGSTGRWLSYVSHADTTPFKPSNCGFNVPWSHIMIDKFAGTPIKTITLSLNDHTSAIGECVITHYGIEGSGIYHMSGMIRDHIAKHGPSPIFMDLLPDLPESTLLERLSKPRGSQSLSTYLKKILHLPPVKINLLYEACPPHTLKTTASLFSALKALPIPIHSPRPLDEAISTAGGLRATAISPHGMLLAHPGVFACGEMLDWDAPTGGYLLTGCLATGKAVGKAAARYAAI
jgi:uncharacterized flavoprotein (TIGR03862 family)